MGRAGIRRPSSIGGDDRQGATGYGRPMVDQSNGKLHDKVAVITGASNGIGRACAERFASEGALSLIHISEPTRPY